MIDVDPLARSAQYREAVRTRLRADVGLDIDFAGCRVPSHNPALVPVDFAALEQDVRACLLSSGADLPPALAPPGAPRDETAHPVDDAGRRWMLRA